MDPVGPSAIADGRVVVFGEVLFDGFPDGSRVLGGAPFNVACHLRGFGLDPLLISRVGRDALGERVVEEMARRGLDTTAIQRDPEHATGFVDVRLDEGEPTFEIAGNQAFDFIEWQECFDALRPAMTYCGTLAGRHASSRATMDRLLDRPIHRVFVDVNLRAPWWEPSRTLRQLERATHVKLNEAELTALTPQAPPDEGLDSRARALLGDLALRMLCVTRGADGAAVFTHDGKRFDVRPAFATRVVDTVGAGDAFSAVLILGQLKSWPLATTFDRAQEFAAAIVGQRGATPTDIDDYTNLAKAWRIE